MSLIHATGVSLNGPDFGPYSGQRHHWSTRRPESLNGPDFGPYSGPKRITIPIRKRDVSTGLTSAHIPDLLSVLVYLFRKSQRA